MNVYTLTLATVAERKILFEDDFNDNENGWEETDTDSEYAFVHNSHYNLGNRSESQWMFYTKQMHQPFPKQFVLNASFELMEHSGFGQFGLIWGFCKPHHVLNRFVVSCEEDRFSIVRFEKDHDPTYHRFSHSFQRDPAQRSHYFISVMLLNEYYYFFLEPNAGPVYICHRMHLPSSGKYFGFYVEPGIQVRASKIRLQQLITKPDKGSERLTVVEEPLCGN